MSTVCSRKNFIVVVSLLAAARCALGDPLAPPDFLGLKWGISKEEVKNEMKDKNTRVAPALTTETHLCFRDGTAAGMPVDLWDLIVTGDKFWRGEITFKSDDPDGLFRQVKKTLTDKYGTRQHETFKEEPLAEWTLNNPTTKDTVTISLSLHGRNKGRLLKLEYVNETIKKASPPDEAPKKPDGGL
jgi:hypothetical protein